MLDYFKIVLAKLHSMHLLGQNEPWPVIYLQFSLNHLNHQHKGV